MNTKFLLYPHAGSGNHGCEALVRGTCELLEIKKDDTYLFSTGIEQDKNVHLDEICQLRNQNQEIQRMSIGYLKAIVQNKILKDQEAYDRLSFKGLFDLVDKNTIALSIGGDNYCYGRPAHIYFMNKYIRQKGAKNILWGCSIEPTEINKEMKQDLKGYDMIVTRESITYNVLKKINPNTVLYPDVAFQLDTVKLDLPSIFEENNTVGINVSPLILEREGNEGITLKNYKNLISGILDNTDMKIALIPHVCWENNDDRKPLNILYEEFKDSGRVVMIGEHKCMEQKGFIARCRFFIGARTHATIAAYSSCVPTLVVGYSVKAKGIATDLFGTYDNYVIPVQSLQKEDDLWNGFLWMLENERKIKEHLYTVMPEYKNKVLELKSKIYSLIE